MKLFVLKVSVGIGGAADVAGGERCGFGYNKAAGDVWEAGKAVLVECGLGNAQDGSVGIVEGRERRICGDPERALLNEDKNMHKIAKMKMILQI